VGCRCTCSREGDSILSDAEAEIASPLVENGFRAMRDLLRAIFPLLVDTPDPAALEDRDTPEGLAWAIRQGVAP
jgi:hypothetical protein